MDTIGIIPCSLLRPAHLPGGSDASPTLVAGRGRGSTASAERGLLSIAVVTSGTVQAVIGDGSLRLRAGEALVFPQEERSTVAGTDPESRWLLATIPPEAARMAPAFDRRTEPLLVPGLHARAATAAGIARVLLEMAGDGPDETPARAPLAAQHLLDSLLREVDTLDRRYDAMIARCPGRALQTRRSVFCRLQRLCLQIAMRPERDYALADLAARARYAKHHFAHTFARVFDCTPMEFVRAVRTQRACELLSGTDLAISEIVRVAGFESHQAFCRVFRKQTGSSPSGVRANPDRYSTSAHPLRRTA